MFEGTNSQRFALIPHDLNDNCENVLIDLMTSLVSRIILLPVLALRGPASQISSRCFYIQYVRIWTFLSLVLRMHIRYWVEGVKVRIFDTRSSLGLGTRGGTLETRV